MNHGELHAKVVPSLLTGTARHPLPSNMIRPLDAGSDGALEMLSLMGQAMRFERPSAPASFVVETQIKDDRRIIADRLRRPLIRLLTGKLPTGHCEKAVARAFDRLRLRPHPFDMPVIDAFVKLYAEKLGPAAQHWANRQKAEAETLNYFDPTVVDDSNWMHARLSRRAEYLEERRRGDADAARDLVESTWAQEESEARVRLLQALQTQLSVNDQPFLTTLEKDRSPRVRALAARFLARLSAGANPALAGCLERIKQSKRGIIRRRTALELEFPANVKDQAASRWIIDTFKDVSCSELAAAFQMTERELIEAAAKDEPLQQALALVATHDRRLDLLGQIVVNLPHAWEKILESGLDSLGAMTETERQHWVEIIVLPYGKTLPANCFLWEWLHRLTDSAVPTTVMSIVLETGFLSRVPEAERGALPWCELIAALCPAPQRTELRAQFADFDASQTTTALALLDILDGMENDRTHA